MAWNRIVQTIVFLRVIIRKISQILHMAWNRIVRALMFSRGDYSDTIKYIDNLLVELISRNINNK